ncbi:MAG: enoyl-CoA hydratase/isomerase family protein [Rhizobiaceae bacterium]
MSDPVVLTHRVDAALWITINRPDKRNALNDQVLAGIASAWREAEADDGVRVIVLTGAGEKAFCAGGDLQPGGGFAFDLSQPRLGYADLLRQAQASTKVSIARINGVCMAGGMGLAAMTDFAIAASGATFGLPEVKVGVFPMQVLSLLQQIVPRRTLLEWCLGGEPFDAAEAVRAGFINRAVDAGQLDAEIERLAQTLASRSPTALRRGKAAMQAMASMSFEQGLAFGEAQIMLLAQTEDAREGLASFAEKRPPNWTGR